MGKLLSLIMGKRLERDIRSVEIVRKSGEERTVMNARFEAVAKLMADTLRHLAENNGPVGGQKD